MSSDPAYGYANSKLNQLKLFFFDETGSQEMTKLLPHGAFMVPVQTKNEKYIEIEGSKLQRLFKSP